MSVQNRRYVFFPSSWWSFASTTVTVLMVAATPMVVNSQEVANYGVDVSFPMQHQNVSNNYPWLPHNVDPSVPTPEEYKDIPLQPLGDKRAFYKEFMDGCYEKFGEKGFRCKQNEDERIAMSLRQPQSMQNYTAVGYAKIKAPDGIFNMIKDYWELNKDKAKIENWPVGNTYTNNWASPTEMVSVEDATLPGGGRLLKQRIWNAARDIIQEWTNEELTESSLYGIRVYREGSILATHVDRLPLVSSAIINVAQDVDEPWPLEVYGHDGRAVNITMEPGDMVLYESHSVLHGRPFPLKGRFYANIFIHFEPVGHSSRYRAMKRGLSEEEAAKEVAREAEKADLPPYIIPGTPEEANWRKRHGGKKQGSAGGFSLGHVAAQAGDLQVVKEEVSKNKHLVNSRDENGWTPLHEAARGGHMDIVKYLISEGADPKIKTGGEGGTALDWAKKSLGDTHPVVAYLKESFSNFQAGSEL